MNAHEAKKIADYKSKSKDDSVMEMVMPFIEKAARNGLYSYTTCISMSPVVLKRFRDMGYSVVVFDEREGTSYTTISWS